MVKVAVSSIYTIISIRELIFSQMRVGDKIGKNFLLAGYIVELHIAKCLNSIITDYTTKRSGN